MRRNSFIARVDSAVVRLATVLSLLGVATAVLVEALGGISRWMLVASVALAGLIISWIQSAPPVHARRVAGHGHRRATVRRRVLL